VTTEPVSAAVSFASVHARAELARPAPVNAAASSASIQLIDPDAPLTAAASISDESNHP
jgi:hypothetical protein